MARLQPKPLTLILAGGPGTRLDVLTQRRAKPAMPFAGLYRLIDFPLSNCLHSGLSDVWVIEQYEPLSLSDHLANGRPWDLDRTYGGLITLHPFLSREGGDFHRGTADAVHSNSSFIREFGPDVVLVMSSDHIYKLDYRDVIDRHLETSADVTMVTTEVQRSDAGRFGVVETDGNGRIVSYIRKPEEPSSDLVAIEVFVFRTSALLATLDELARKIDNEEGDAAALEDLGDELLPRLVDSGVAVEFRLPGYWRDVGTISSYWVGHQDLLFNEQALQLNDPAWPIHTLGQTRPPAHIHDSAKVRDSLVAPGASVRGTVERSVLGPDVIVEEGGVVLDSVVLGSVTIESGAMVETAIVDVEAHIGERARVGASHDREQVPSEEEITIVGMRASIDPDASLPAGTRIEAEG
ncbi:MAG: glucose-1-phosphate adenylyltransferase family protein [Nitriliruptorales bacterium]